MESLRKDGTNYWAAAVRPMGMARYIEIFLGKDDIPNRKCYVAKASKLTWHEVNEFNELRSPTFKLDLVQAKELWERLGAELGMLSGDNDHHIAGELKATKEHLKDVRERIVKGDALLDRFVRIATEPRVEIQKRGE